MCKGAASAARTRNVTAAHDHEMPAAHPSDPSCPCFVESGAIPDTSTSPQCNRGAIPRGLKTALRLTKFEDRDSYASTYRQLRVTMSNRPGATNAPVPLLENYHHHSGLAKAPGQVHRCGLIPRTCAIQTYPSSCLVNVGRTSDLTLDADGNFAVPFLTPSGYDQTVDVPQAFANHRH
jgi:hypothetical protein